MTEAEPPPKRNCLGCALKGGLGCLAFLLGGILVAWLLADRITNGVAKRAVQSAFSDSYEGQLEIGQIHLGLTDWSERQSIESIHVLDPDGERVLTASVELPPLTEFWSLWTNRKTAEDVQLGLIRVALSGQIVADEEGVTNLDRALAEVEYDTTGGEISVSGPSAEGLDVLDILSRLSMECALDVSELTYSDARTRELGGEVVVRQFTARAIGRAGGAWRFHLEGDVVAPGEGQEEGKIFAEFNAPEPTWGRAEWPFGVMQGQGSAKELRTAVLDGLSGQNGLVSETLGETVDFEFHLVDATPESGRVELISHSAKQDLVFEGLFKEGRLSIDGTEGFVWRLELPKRLIDEELAALVPEETARLELSNLAPGERLTLALDRLEIPISDPNQVSDAGFSPLRSARQARFAGRLEMPGRLVAKLPQGSLAVAAQNQTPLLRFEQGEDGVPRLTVRMDLQNLESASPDANLTVEAAGSGLWRKVLDPDFAEDDLADVVEADAQIHFEVLRTASFQVFVPGEENLTDWLGASGVLDLRVPDALQEERTVRGEWLSEALRVDIDVRQSPQWKLSGDTDSGPALRVRFLGPQLERRLQQALPAGNRISLPGAFVAEGGAEFALSELLLANSENEEEAFAPERSRLTGRFLLPALRVQSTQASAPDAVLENVVLAFQLPESGPARIDLTSSVTGRPDAQLEAHVLGKQPWASLLEASQDLEAEVVEGAEANPGLSAATFDITANARSVPTLLIDGLGKGDGLLVDVLGESLEAELRAANLGMNTGRLETQFQSGLGEVQWKGRMEEGRLISEGEDMLDASVALTPLFSRRIVGSLVPLLVNVSKDDDISPVTLDVSNCVLPLDGDLTKLSGKVSLNLGEVYYSVLPQFEEWLGDVTRTKATEIAPLTFAITNGVVAYDKLPLKIEGNVYDFAGTFDLTSRKLALATSVPLTHLGSSVSKELARAREDFDLDPNLAVPLEIGGTLTRPRVKLASGFLEGLTGDLLKQGLEKELLKGLEKLLGKD